MAKSSSMGGSRSNRMSSMVAGDKPRGEGSYRAGSTVRAESYPNSPALGSPVTNLGANITTKKAITARVPTYLTSLPSYAAGLKNKKPTIAKTIPRTYVPTVKPPAKKPTVVVKPTAKKPVVTPVAKKSILNDLRSALGMASTKSAPRGSMAINPRTGNTTGFTTGTTTGSSASKPGVAGKTYQSAYDRQMSNALNRTNQPAGPMGGGGGTRGSGSSRSTSSGGGNLGGAAGRGEPRGSKK